MNRPSARFAGALAAAVLALAAPAAAPAQAAPGTAPVVPEQVASFAATTGLTYDAAREYFALTPAVGALQERGVAEYGATFAGVWRTPSDGGLVHVAFTRDAAASAARLTDGFPRPDLVRVTTARHSLSALGVLASRVAGDRAGAATVAVDVVAGAVEVTVPSAAAAAAAADRYAGQPVRVTVGAQPAAHVAGCTRDALCPGNAYGGIELLGNEKLSLYSCTSGFDATYLATGKPVLLTAGHCYPKGGTVSHNGVPIGSVIHRVWPGGDAEAIEQLPAYPSTNRVLWNDAGLLVSVTGVVGRGYSEAVGAPVCRTGITTENQCGVIQQLNVTVTYVSGETLHGLTKTSACSQPGDSGGPFMSGNVAYGITSGGTVGACGSSTYSLYYPAPRVEGDLGARINTTNGELPVLR